MSIRSARRAVSTGALHLPTPLLAVLGAAAFYGLGDGLTTLYIFYHPSLVETNPFVQWLGVPGFIAAKALLMAIVYWMYLFSREITEADYSFFVVVFAGLLAVEGFYLTVHNLALIASV